MTQARRTRRAGRTRDGTPAVQLGLRANLAQFVLLAVVNFFVGGMVGLERTVTPLVGSEQFHLGEIAVAAFVVVFGFTKAITNAAAGAITARHTRKAILVAGWLIGVPVPFMLGWGPSWAWVIGANLLLGVNQGLTWSMTVNMKIDLIGPGRRRLRPGHQRDRRLPRRRCHRPGHRLPRQLVRAASRPRAAGRGLRHRRAGLVHPRGPRHRRLGPRRGPPAPSAGRAASAVPRDRQAGLVDRPHPGIGEPGLVNNLNDGLVWVVLPVLLVSHGVSITGVGYI